MNAVERHADGLIALAIRWERERPGLRMFAWVSEANAREEFDMGPDSDYVLTGEDGSVAVLMERDRVKQILAKAQPRMLDWLPPDEPGEGRRRTLPIVYSTPDGRCTMKLNYERPF